MSRLKSIRLPVSANLKVLLIVLALIIVAGTLLYTQRLVTELKNSERKTTGFFVMMLSKASSTLQSSNDASDLLYDLYATIEYPVIVTNDKYEPQAVINRKGVDTAYTELVKNVSFDSLVPPYKQKAELEQRIAEMSRIYDPLPVYSVTSHDSIAMQNGKEVHYAISDSMIVNYVFYDESDLVKRLRWLPYVEITIGAMFILIGYLSFSHIKRNEQSNIWVGMAKETAHQLGTPLSSLLGWIELVRMMPDDHEQVLEAADEMQRDVERLNKVAHRFSKIGSAAEVRTVDVNAIIKNIVGYFERRLPHLGKKVSLVLDTSDHAYVAINADLFEWVFENLVRNAADAIDRANGEIRFCVRTVRNNVVIDIKDNGRGIDPKVRKDIFRPGFSTKKRGWGLGLSLAKRIVEDYHGGKITLKESSPKGTTFRIVLNAAEPPTDAAPEQSVRDVRSQKLEVRG